MKIYTRICSQKPIQNFSVIFYIVNNYLDEKPSKYVEVNRFVYYDYDQNIFFVLGFLQSCHWVSASHLRQQEGILILFLFLFNELNFVKLLLRFVRPL